MFRVARPDAATITRVLAEQAALPLSYPDVGASRGGEAPRGYVLDHNQQRLGRGGEVFASACRQLRAWRMLPAWLAAEPAPVAIAEGQVLAMLVHALGVWWINPARIVYLIEEPRRFGFAYGTLPGHAESGEERFLVEHAADDTVTYDIRAFSRPRLWAARAAYPVTRALQRRFARDSKDAMLRALR